MLDALPPAAADLVVVADGERLAQAVINLASNAVQHTLDGDEVGVGVAVSHTEARLWVRDTGPGVDPAVIDTLFDRYSRAASNRERRRDGAGIGLSIVDAVARAHGGSVTVESRAGSGATFVITIPTGLRPARASWPPPVSPPAPQAQQEVPT